MFVTRKDNETAVFQHAIGYRFLDQAAEQRGFFNGMTLEFIFMGGNFTSSSWLLLTKHRKLIRMLQLDGRATHLLKNMFYTLCRKESILPPRKEYEAHEADMMRIVNELFEKSLTRGLYTEEKTFLTCSICCKSLLKQKPADIFHQRAFVYIQIFSFFSLNKYHHLLYIDIAHHLC